MIIAYHAIFTTYGTWLPNDPRGSYSKAVYKAELAALGRIRYGRQSPQPAGRTIGRFRTAALKRLSRPPYYINGTTRPVVAEGFARVVERLHLEVPACTIMNEHVHVVVLRSKYRIEYLVNQLKGGATSALELDKTPWTRNRWKVFIDDEEALQAAVEYVVANPQAAGLKPQSWGFVKPLSF
ncbi:MAG: transposase [Candidatus Nealsonbacteria bacterium]|nr:transposase [Candidatus Nealsonbacteria bacterium]